MGFIRSIDGERDPRNLLLGFTVFCRLCREFDVPSETRDVRFQSLPRLGRLAYLFARSYLMLLLATFRSRSGHLLEIPWGFPQKISNWACCMSMTSFSISTMSQLMSVPGIVLQHPWISRRWHYRFCWKSWRQT